MADDSLIGRQLANFRIERVIGRGGMAQVYYGLDVKLWRPVAIKVIDARYRDDPAYAQRFVREAQTVATWRHENIVQVFFADEQDDLYYFVMEYIDGPSLAELLAEVEAEGCLVPHEKVLRIGRAVASALDYAHQKGVVHRDVKPGNVMTTSDGRVILTDFGLAMDVRQGSQGKVFGSSHYIAPEQARSSADAVPQSDLYSLGVILFEMLTGVVPFDDPSPTSVALQHVTLPPPSPRQINPDLNAETEVVLLKALSKSPEDRYQTGGELLDALERALRFAQPAAATGVGLPPIPVGVPQAEDSLLGQKLDEYRLDALLGRGGMARIYRGLDVRLKRHVAIKVIDTPFRSDSDHVMRFEREARAIAQLEHPNIVRLYRYGEAKGVLYIAMQYIEGRSLLSELAACRQRQELIVPDAVSRIVREVCLALDYAHSRGVIHRDVKPSNIMLDEKGHAILTDFGLALLTDIGTRGEVLGSLHYIAPEQAISSARAVPQSDLYAVGVILYEMFTGQLPFDSEDPLDIAMKHMAEPPPAPRRLRRDLSPELEAVILKALSKDPQDRYPTGAALADALEQALQAASLESLPPSSSDRVAAPPPGDAVQKPPLRPLPPIPAAIAAPASRPPTSAVAPPRAAGPSTHVPRRARRFLYLGLGAAGVLLAIALVVVLMQAGLIGGAGAPTETVMPTAATVVASATPEPTITSTSAPAVPPLPTKLPTATLTRLPTAAPTSTRPPTAVRTSTRLPTTTATAMPTEPPTATATPTAPSTATPLPTRPPTATPTPFPPTLAELRGWILFLSDRTGEGAVFAMRIDDGEVLALPDRRLYDEAAEAEVTHPYDASRLRERIYDDGNIDIWRQGENWELQVTSNSAADYHPAWSPDGQRITFVSGRYGNDEVLVVDADLQGERRLTYHDGFDKHPTWAPDGRRIAFGSDREEGRWQIWVIDLDGASLANLSNSPFNDWDPIWVK